MNCDQLQQMLRELAAGAGIEAEARRAATLHLSSCLYCAARLAEERQLSASLAALAQSMEGRGAPAHVEYALKEAFLARREDAKPRFASATFTRWSWRAAGAAAVVLIAVAGALFLRTPAPRAVGPAQYPMQRPARQPTEETTPQAPIIAADNFPAQAREPEEAPPAAAEEESAVVTQMPPSQEEHLRETERTAARGNEEADLRASRMASEAFVPLFYGGDPGLLETGQVLRVELPARVLESFGIPVHEELRMRRVRADLLVGEDGTARAIRFLY